MHFILKVTLNNGNGILKFHEHRQKICLGNLIKFSNDKIVKLIYLVDPKCFQQTCFCLQTLLILKNSPKYNISIEGLFSYTSCHDGGRPGG